MIFRIAILLAGLLVAFDVWAVDFTASGTVLTVTYKEPTTNVDGSPLTDLNQTNVYYSINGGAEVKSGNIPPTSVNGGGNVTTTVTVPIAQNQSASVTIRATATDISGNESAKSAAVTKTVDRLPPMPPQ